MDILINLHGDLFFKRMHDENLEKILKAMKGYFYKEEF